MARTEITYYKKYKAIRKQIPEEWILMSEEEKTAYMHSMPDRLDKPKEYDIE